MALTIGVDFEHSIDAAIAGFVTTQSSNIVSGITPFCITAVTLYFILTGYNVAFGRVQEPATELFWRFFKISFLSAIALSAGTYQTDIVNFVYSIPQGIISSMGLGNSIGALMDNGATPFNALYAAISSKASWNPATAIGLFLQAAWFLIVELILFISAMGYFMLTKIALALLLAVGPIFIFCAAFPATQKFTETWIAQCLQYGLLQIFLGAMFAMLVGIAKYFADKAVINVNTLSYVDDLYALEFIALAMIVMIFNVNSIASALSGGIGISGLSHSVTRVLMNQLFRGGSRPSAPLPITNQITRKAASQTLYNQNTLRNISA
jgi:type IV secretion system protein VirB6